MSEIFAETMCDVLKKLSFKKVILDLKSGRTVKGIILDYNGNEVVCISVARKRILLNFVDAKSIECIRGIKQEFLNP